MRKLFLITLLFSFTFLDSFAQACPDNIDFERGSFANWQCIDGKIKINTDIFSDSFSITTNTTTPIPGRHVVFDALASPPNDFYGDFSVASPNGSRYSVQLGNTDRGGLVTGVKYNVQIPAAQQRFILQYNYAVVYESPNHQQAYQPRFQIIVKDLSTNEILECNSLTFFANPNQQGFLKSTKRHKGTDVLYKNWAPATLLLKNMAGKNIEITFLVTGCAYAEHFGYAYLDVNSLCNENLEGATYCKDDPSIYIKGPAGYETYKWYNSDYSQVIATTQDLKITPAPPDKTIFKLIGFPFFKPNCSDTFLIEARDTLRVKADAGRDTTVCANVGVKIGAAPQDGVYYSWSPTIGMSDSTISNPIVKPAIATKYTLKAKSYAGACVGTDEVWVRPFIQNTKIILEGQDSVCLSDGDSAVLVSNTNEKLQWFRDSTLLPASGSRYSVKQPGTYYAKVFPPEGCIYTTNSINVYVETAGKGVRYPDLSIVTGYQNTLMARPLGVKYNWSPPDDLDNPDKANPILTGGTVAHDYTVTITTITGCIIVDSLHTFIYPGIAIYVPSAFTPNGDGRNDFLKPNLRGIRKLNYFKIFDRYGLQVFDFDNQPKGWDGRYKQNLQNGETFIWIAEGIGIDNKTYQVKGTVLLLR